MTAEPTWARAAAGRYLHANAAFDDELGRLRLLEARYDPRTFARLSMFGPLAGTRCLEVGAGAGSVARWLAAQVGPSGQVVVAGRRHMDPVGHYNRPDIFQFHVDTSPRPAFVEHGPATDPGTFPATSLGGQPG